MQDMEFTIERGKLFMLQTRNGKRTAQAALKIAVDLVEENMITREEALMKVDPKQLDTLLHPQFEPKALKAAKPVAKGLPASPGAATGKIYFSADDAAKAFKNGEQVILVRVETSPEDIEGMHVSQGILTGRGGMTSMLLLLQEVWADAVLLDAVKLQLKKKRNILLIKTAGDTTRGTGFPLTVPPDMYTVNNCRQYRLK